MGKKTLKIKNFNLEKNIFSELIYLNISFEIRDRSFHWNLSLDFEELWIEKEILNFDNLNKKDFIEIDKIILDYLEKNLSIERWENWVLEEFDKFYNWKFYKILWNVYYSDFLFLNNYYFYKTDLVRKALRISPEKVSCNYFKVYFNKPNFIEKVYSEWKEIIWADEETFEVIDQYNSKDKNNSYFKEKVKPIKKSFLQKIFSFFRW